MKLRAWRIVKARYVDTAFEGEGAALAPGRWNRPGIRMVYTSSSAALALLEIVANADPEDLSEDLPLGEFLAIPVVFDHASVLRLSVLPKDWNALSVPDGTRDAGSQWVRDLRSPVLRVPSVCMPLECNYLLNPLHPGFRLIRIGSPRPVPVDPRLLRKG